MLVIEKVKEGLDIKKASLVLSILGMALLLLFSPCKVRNFIEVELGLPQSEVLNKSQSVVSQSVCQTFDLSEIIHSSSKPTIQKPGFLISDDYNSEFKVDLHNYFFTPYTSVIQQVVEIPLYILYQNLKLHL